MPIMNTVIQGGGTTPTGTKSITANGVYDVTDFASADVQVPTTAPAHYIEKTVDASGKLVGAANFISLSGATSIESYGLAHAYAGVTFTDDSYIDMSSITSLSNYSCYSMFVNSWGKKIVDLSGLTSVSLPSSLGSMFSGAHIKSIDLSNLETVSGTNGMSYMFNNSSYLETLSFPKLTTVSSGGCFDSLCSNSEVENVYFDKLNSFPGGLCSSWSPLFGNARNLENIYFGGLVAATFSGGLGRLNNMFNSNSGSSSANGCTVHFPSNFDPSDPNHTFDASTLTGYPTFGGSASYIHVAFDLPATE